MRNLKFRAWVPKGYTRWGKGGGMLMLSWEELLNDLHSEINPKKSVLGIGMSHLEEGVVFMQFTGLQDNNGKEIYEGDIVKAPFVYDGEDKYDEGEYLGEVFYKECSFNIKQSHDGYTPQLSNTTIVSLEVIGNIYENPELMSNVQ